MDDEKVLKEFSERLSESAAGLESWRDAAAEEYRFYVGLQWSDADRTALEAAGRAPIEWNHIAPIIDMLVGAESQAKLAAKFIPRTVGGDGTVASDDDTGTAEVLNQLLAYEREQSGASDEENRAWKDVLIQGMGVTSTRLDMESDPDGLIRTEWIDPFSILPDPDSASRAYRDAEYVMAWRDYSEAGLEERWPGKSQEVQSSIVEGLDKRGVVLSDSHGVDGRPSDYNDHSSVGWSQMARRKRYRIYEYQFWRREPVYRWAAPDSQELAELDEAAYSTLVKNTRAALDEAISRANAADAAISSASAVVSATPGMSSPFPPAPGVVPPPPPDLLMAAAQARHLVAKLANVAERLAGAVKGSKRVYYRAFIAGGSFLEPPEKLPTNGFTYQLICGKWDRENGRHYGIVRAMISPQEWTNKSLSTTIDILQSNPKGGIIVEESAVADPQEFEENWARGDGVSFVRDGSLGKITPKPSPPIIPQLDRLLQLAMGGVSQVSGVSPVMRGAGGANTPGVTVAQYMRQGYAGLSQYFDAMRRYRREQSRIALDFARVLPDRTIARVISSEQVRYIRFAKSKLAARYDLVIDEAPDSPNSRAETLQKLQLILPTMEKIGAGAEIMIDIVENLGLPATLVEKIKQRLSAPPMLPPVAAPRQMPGIPGGGAGPPGPMPQGLAPGMMPQSGPGGPMPAGPQ